jgi:hypothetical protein
MAEKRSILDPKMAEKEMTLGSSCQSPGGESLDYSQLNTYLEQV